VFFDWLRMDVVDTKEAKLSRFKEHTHTKTMKKRVTFDSAKRTAQFAAIQDDIAKLFDSSDSDSSSSNADETEAQKRQRAKEAKHKLDKKKAKRKKAKELSIKIDADKVCHEAEEEAFKAEVADGTEDNSLSKVGTLACISFENRIWYNLGMLLWVNHRGGFEEQLHYLQNNLAKPRKMSVLESVKRVEILFKYMPFLPPPSSKNMTYDQADWKKRNLLIDKATIRRCQFHALPESYQKSCWTTQKIGRLRKRWSGRIVYFVLKSSTRSSWRPRIGSPRKPIRQRRQPAELMTRATPSDTRRT